MCEDKTKPLLDMQGLQNLSAGDVLHKNEGVKWRKRKTQDPEHSKSNTRRKQRELPGRWEGAQLSHGPRGQPTQELKASGRNGCLYVNGVDVRRNYW